MTRRVEGYGSHHHLHTKRLRELSENLPVLIEIMDVPEKIDPLLAALGTMIGEGLVRVSNVHILRFLTHPKA